MVKGPYEEVINYWNSKNIILVRQVTAKLKTQINRLFKDYKIKDIKKAIDTYDLVLKSDKHYYTFKWTLPDFLNRSLDKFIDNEPDYYLKHDNKKENSNDSGPKFDNPDWL